MKADLDLLNQFYTRVEREKAFRGYKSILRDVQAFHFDNETIEVVGEMASGLGRNKRIPMYRELARLPFEHVWIEFDFAHLHQWRLARGYAKEDNTANYFEFGDDSEHSIWGTPTRMAFLCERLKSHEEAMRITTVGHMSPGYNDATKDWDAPTACLFPICHNLTCGRDKVTFALHRHDWPNLARIVDDANRSILPALAWGMDKETIDLDVWKQQPLYGTNGVEPEGNFTDILFGKYGLTDGLRRIESGMVAGAREQMGDLRLIVAALAMLNHVPVVYKPHRPKGRLLAASTTRPFIESRIVTISVPNTRKRIKLIDRELRNSLALQRRKRHRVRGHWRVSDRSHGDRWQPFMDPFTLRRRWGIWIADHERGDASLGWVDHTYEVTGRPGALDAVGLPPPGLIPVPPEEHP